MHILCFYLWRRFAKIAASTAIEKDGNKIVKYRSEKQKTKFNLQIYIQLKTPFRFWTECPQLYGFDTVAGVCNDCNAQPNQQCQTQIQRFIIDPHNITTIIFQFLSKFRTMVKFLCIYSRYSMIFQTLFS